MKQFPRIYSISTVGIMLHYNRDYILHPLRTDFNGESGSGKSMIADFLQLIFIAKKGSKFYKPGTESSSNHGRDPENLPLDNIGYIFINIQKTEKEFLTIGIYIQKNSKNITPFIIQKGINWERNSRFEYIDKILLYKDFLTESFDIPEIEILKKDILKPKGVILETFFGSKTSLYHHLLFENKILPMDLSQEDDKLITYGQIIQSFARAKSLKFEKNQLKDFLFADDEEIYNEYKNLIDELEGYHRQYIKQRGTISNVEKIFEALKKLKEAKINKDKAEDFYIIAKTSLEYNEYQNALLDFKKCKQEYAKNELLINYYHTKVANNKLLQLLQSISEQQQKLQINEATFESNKLDLENAKEKEISIQALLDEKQNDFFEARRIDDILKKIDVWLIRYGSINEISNIIASQSKYISDKAKLTALIKGLTDKKIQDDFNDIFITHFTEGYQNGIETIQKEILEYKNKITRLTSLLNLYEKNESNSLINWIIKNKKTLSIYQESVLKHFIDVTIKKPSELSAFNKYIPNPENLLNFLTIHKETDDFFWLDMGGIHECISLEKNPILDKEEDILIKLDKQREQIENELEQLKNALDKKNLIKNVLYECDCNQELLNLFNDKDNLINYIEDTTLPGINDFRTYEQLYKDSEKHKERYKKLSEEWNELNISIGATKAAIKIYEGQEIIQKNAIQALIKEINEKEAEQSGIKIEISTHEERILGIKAEYHEIISESFIEDILLIVSSNIKKFEKGKTIDEARLFKDAITPLVSTNGSNEEKIKSYSTPEHPLSIANAEKKYIEAAQKYFLNKKTDYNPIHHPGKYDRESVETAQKNLNNASIIFSNIYTGIIVPLAEDNERIKNSEDFNIIAKELLPKVFEGKEKINIEEKLEEEIKDHLNSINESLKAIDDHKLKLILSIFNKVYSVYDEYEDKIKDIRSFFEEKEITGNMKVKVDFHTSKHYPINWIETLKKRITNKSINLTPLFRNNDNENSTAEDIIIQTFKDHSDSKIKDPDIKKLTNPKSYFDVEVNLIRASGEKTDGSSGQDYAKIALLCIARLSKIERDKRLKKGEIIPGIRFMPIDEVAGLGGNFDLLYQIAQEYDYQIITMTISPDLIQEDGNQYVYMFNNNKESNEKKINMPPFGLFNQNGLQKSIEAYITALHNEKKLNLEDN